MAMNLNHVVFATFSVGSMMFLGCTPHAESEQRAVTANTIDEEPPGGSRARDRSVWVQLLSDHTKIRRTVIHREDGDLGIVEAVTESDDPAVAARIIDHAQAMQTRMKSGARVRAWDPVFRELFDRHDLVAIEVTPTEKGVRIVESSRDPEAIALLRAHAIGVSEFVRHGHEAGGRETARFAVGSPLPPPEVAIGGVPHRFLLAQPSQAQLGGLKAEGVGRVVNFRRADEPGVFDEASATAAIGLEYAGMPYKDAAELTDALLLEAREEFRAAAQDGSVLALHCRTGNRVGPGWAMHRALDKGDSIEDAIVAAKAVGLVDPLYESITRDAIRRAKAADGAEPLWTEIDAPRTAAEAEQKSRAEDARAEMFSRLVAALGEAMSAPAADGTPAGPVAAISVCKTEAPRIAQAVAREKGVMIGRTSDRLRNTANAAPAWAVELLSPRPESARLAANTDGSLGVTMPITISAQCIACHGARDRLAPGVAEALAKVYPKDQATGYDDGDLRGWFWVEVPPPTVGVAGAR
ncbi:MAG: DUF3365 domain-containing protein [Phycisphaera sp.]|nr:DUF3365 domain-containing protein [Phycisphaera sp.]